MKAIIDVPFEALEEYKDDGLGQMLANSRLGYITIYPVHAHQIMRYELVGDLDKVRPIQAKLTSIILTHRRNNNGTASPSINT